MRYSLILLLLVCGLYGQEDFSKIDLSTYLLNQGAFVTEGYITSKQKEEFILDIQKQTKIQRIMEIGFNAGHSAELFLTATNCEKLVSFDINMHPYLKIGREFISKKFGDRFTLIGGDSRVEVPNYAASHPHEKFDLIFIDGGHSFDCCLKDIQNCKQFAHPETLILIDDVVGEIGKAVHHSIKHRWISLVGLKRTHDSYIPNVNSGDRVWAVARYIIE